MECSGDEIIVLLINSKLPLISPTIIPPKKWTGMWGGGFYAGIINNLPLVRAH